MGGARESSRRPGEGQLTGAREIQTFPGFFVSGRVRGHDQATQGEGGEIGVSEAPRRAENRDSYVEGERGPRVPVCPSECRDHSVCWRRTLPVCRAASGTSSLRTDPTRRQLWSMTTCTGNVLMSTGRSVIRYSLKRWRFAERAGLRGGPSMRPCAWAVQQARKNRFDTGTRARTVATSRAIRAGGISLF